ncbi:DHS-like NAD/FAD-binding domain-containing protein [Fistulina hepatica ATCC 64428]|uniref:DHS-like NAD/FAD-binding domain-containing protein n=1 Tax=Fistulina hepatica ATCC 64428 TaxID=1128425 RepID=A0A0D7ABP3_9AGAR|nr:DHS-like NAD/FAD-binding domain-containing protein [Fistulina hepatica ATCC 64428]
MPASRDIQAFRDALRNSKKIIILAGAGLSAGSGIPTYKGAGGRWRTYKSSELATLEAFRRDPSLIWQFYEYRRNLVMKAEPNAAHYAIAKLCSDLEVLQKIAPQAHFVKFVTQNVDGLSVRALPPHAPESAEPIEIHGNLLRVRCSRVKRRCAFVEMNMDTPICPALGAAAASGEVVSIEAKDLPRCSKCGALARPDVVWFGENVRQFKEVETMVQDGCDMMLVVGTSSEIYPVAFFPEIVIENGGKVAVFNTKPGPSDFDMTFLFEGPCEETLPRVLDL